VRVCGGDIRERKRERDSREEVAEELIENFQSSLSSTITQLASILQSETESLTNFVETSSFIFPSKRKGVYLISFFFFLSLSVGTIM